MLASFGNSIDHLVVPTIIAWNICSCFYGKDQSVEQTNYFIIISLILFFVALACVFRPDSYVFISVISLLSSTLLNFFQLKSCYDLHKNKEQEYLERKEKEESQNRKLKKEKKKSKREDKEEDRYQMRRNEEKLKELEKLRDNSLNLESPQSPRVPSNRRIEFPSGY